MKGFSKLKRACAIQEKMSLFLEWMVYNKSEKESHDSREAIKACREPGLCLRRNLKLSSLIIQLMQAYDIREVSNLGESGCAVEW